MPPKTSVRQPVIAGARRQDLSELLRKWRRQPRKRSPLLFWTLLSLALMSDGGLLFLTSGLLDVWESVSPAGDSPVWERLTWEALPAEHGPALPALCSSLLAVLFFAAAAVMKLRWPLWRRRLLLVGLLSGFVSFVWSAAPLGQAVHGGVPPIHDGSQGMLWMATVVMGLGLFLAVLFRDAFLAFVAAVSSSIGFLAANCWPLVFAEAWPSLPQECTDDTRLRVQVLMLLSAYAALALAWGTAALTLVRILLDEPSSERLRRLAALCLWPIRLGVLLLAASALLDGWRLLDQGFAWHGWNVQGGGTLLVFPGCAALVFAQRREGMPPLRLLATVVLGLASLAIMWQSTMLWESGDLYRGSAGAAENTIFLAGLLPLSLTTHAALRYYFGKRRILEV